MRDILKCIHRCESKFDEKAARFVYRHPLLGFLAVFVGMPIFVLVAVCVCAAIVALPMAWLFGWF